MKNIGILLVISFLCYFPFYLLAQKTLNIPKLYPKEYPQAIILLQSNKQKIATVLATYQIEKQFAIALIFPELLRYNPLQDAVETNANKLFYKNLGAKHCEFSIGAFQMMPSFVEHLEQTILENEEKYKAFLSIAKYKVSEESEVREERVKRLETWSWQLRYLACFITIMKERFPISFANEDEKVRFYATAYNCGYWKSEEEIRKWLKINIFPKGKNYGTQQQNYSEVALYFYKNVKW